MGFARANLIYDKLQRAPKYGSLLEAMCLMVQRHRNDLYILQNRALSQSALGGKEAEKAFGDFINHLNRVEREDTETKMQEKLEKLSEIKEIRFKPLVTTERKLNLPVVEADSLKKDGKLSDFAPVPKHRPQRARPRRTSR